jgi:regulatory protein
VENKANLAKTTSQRAVVCLAIDKARTYAFSLLKFRLRSRKEIYERLKRRKFRAGIIKETLDFLESKGFIDDDSFAKAWITSRIKRPLGLRRLKQELEIKGINKAIIDTKIGEIKNNYNEADVVREIAEAKFNKLKAIKPLNAKKRIYDYFIRRGFSPEVVINIINQLTKNE